MYKLNYANRTINVQKTVNNIIYIVNVTIKLNTTTNKYELSSSRVDVNRIDDATTNPIKTTMIAFNQATGTESTLHFMGTIEDAVKTEVFNVVTPTLTEVYAHAINGTALEFEPAV